MARVNCPICDETIMARDAESLTVGLREHMADVHQMPELRRPLEEREGTEGPVACPAGMETFVGSSGRSEGSAEEQFVGRSEEAIEQKRRSEKEFIGTSRQWEGPREEEFVGRSEESVERSRPSEKGFIGTTKRWGGYREEAPQKGFIGTSGDYCEGVPMVRCPVCGGMLRGDSDDDLSVNLRNHVTESHRLMPKMSGPALR